MEYSIILLFRRWCFHQWLDLPTQRWTCLPPPLGLYPIFYRLPKFNERFGRESWLLPSYLTFLPSATASNPLYFLVWMGHLNLFGRVVLLVDTYKGRTAGSNFLSLLTRIRALLNNQPTTWYVAHNTVRRWFPRSFGIGGVHHFDEVDVV